MMKLLKSPLLVFLIAYGLVSSQVMALEDDHPGDPEELNGGCGRITHFLADMRRPIPFTPWGVFTGVVVPVAGIAFKIYKKVFWPPLSACLECNGTWVNLSASNLSSYTCYQDLLLPCISRFDMNATLARDPNNNLTQIFFYK